MKKLEIIIIKQLDAEVLHIAYVIQKYNGCNKTSIVVHNGPNYDYHFIIRELKNKFGGSFYCLGENTKKYKTF